MKFDSLLLELGYAGYDFFGHGCFMRRSLALPSSGEQSIMITLSTRQSLLLQQF